MTANLRKPTSPSGTKLLIIMTAVSLMAHVLLLGYRHPAWFPHIRLPNDGPIRINLLATPLAAPAGTQESQQKPNRASAPKLPAKRQTTPQLPATAVATPPIQKKNRPANTDTRTAAAAPATPPATSASLLAQLASQDSATPDSLPENNAASGLDSSSRYILERYKQDWRLRMERIGRQNYPATLSARNIYGSVTLQVSILPDGSLQNVRVVRHASNPLVDEAAINMVTQHAPYSPLPAALAAKGSLSITQPFSFGRDNN